MKKRLITAAIASAYAIFVFWLTQKNPALLIVSLSAFSVISVHELMGVIKVPSKTLRASSMIYAALVPFLVGGAAMYCAFTAKNLSVSLETILLILTIIYVLFTLFALLKHYEKVSFETVATLIFGTVAIPLALSLLIKFSQLYYYFPGHFSRGDSMFIFIYTLAVCWTFDGGAYFVGRKFGKHKMAPKISPKKSWEGYIGGIVIGEACCVIYYLLFKHFAAPDMKPQIFNLASVIFMSPIFATLSILGDLSASTIKRNFGVKDFGKFFPGHGGILDRFDSVLYVTPLIYVMALIIVMVK